MFNFLVFYFLICRLLNCCFLDMKSLEDMRLSSLYIVLKDFNNRSLMQTLATSQARCIRKSAQQQNVTLETVVLPKDSDVLTCLWLTSRLDSNVAKELKQGVTVLKSLISIKLVDKSDPSKSYCLFVQIHTCHMSHNFSLLIYHLFVFFYIRFHS